jgi:hypothetical protein
VVALRKGVTDGTAPVIVRPGPAAPPELTLAGINRQGTVTLTKRKEE